MKIYALLAKITACALLVTAIHTAFGVDSATKTQAFRDILATKAAQAARLGWQGATYTGQKAVELGQYVYPSLKAGAEMGAEVAQEAAPYVQAGADKLRQVGKAIDDKTSGYARQAVGYIAEYKWPDMTNKLATIQSTLHRLSTTIRGLNQTFYNLVQILPPDKIEEIKRKAGLVTQAVCPQPVAQP